ncbi:cytochrome P450 [Xylaria bambusicola]|uniref:cytochrome P450 n=1 Tax=Xylaria bambusicola TaxID=326684 RepID=UPI002007490D|nr:cytochrome P450 [Xylaria bambusicola]KAI0518127.1 cytochrome P450 [Xylaria bambusicola]
MTALLQGHGLLGPVLIFLLVIYYFLLRAPNIRRNGVPLRKPPNTLPIAGNGLVFLQDRKKLFSWFVDCERQFGLETFQITVPTLHPGVVINDPSNLDYVFKNEGIFAKGDFVKQRSWDLFGNGIINADGDLWKAQRKAGSHFLSASNLRVLTDVALPRYLSRTIDHIESCVKDSRIVDMQLAFHEITSLLMGKMAYDMEMHADDDFTVAFEHASGVVTERFQNPLWFITEIITGSRFRKSLAIVRKFGLGIVNNAMDDQQKSTEPSAQLDDADGSRLDTVSGSLIHSLLAALGSQQTLVADAALTYLTAGRDTTAQALTWCLYLLMQNKSAMKKIRDEAQELLKLNSIDIQQLGSESDTSPAVFAPASLSYTMAAFYEALRLFPPIPFEIRECEKATTLPDGTFLPEKSVIVWSLWAINRSKRTWGEDADEFRPERWIAKDGKLINKSASEFPVFLMG